jgi:hypothetical protein
MTSTWVHGYSLVLRASSISEAKESVNTEAKVPIKDDVHKETKGRIPVVSMVTYRMLSRSSAQKKAAVISRPLTAS